jgi:hypothetical protein
MDHIPKSRRSIDLYEYVKNICEEISDDLKIKTSDYLCENQNFFQSSDYVEENSDKEKVRFLLQLKLNDEVFIERIFPAHYYHPKVRYTVDIRPKLKRMLGNLTDILSSEELETTYLNYQL